MFKIGEFSKLVRVSPRMLRHYEKCGLVNPARTDGNTGYRYYSADQIPLLARIAELRDVGCSIEEIGDILPRYDDAKSLDAFLRAKAASVQSAIDAENEKLRKLECLSNLMKKERAIMLYEVELKSVDAVTVLALRGTVPRYRDEHLLWTRLGAYLEEQGVPCRDGGYSTYLDDEYQDENPEIEIAVPVAAVGVAEPPFTYRHYPSIPLAATAVATAVGPGIISTASSALRAASTSSHPGSEMQGIPASVTRAICAPSFNRRSSISPASRRLCS